MHVILRNLLNHLNCKIVQVYCLISFNVIILHLLLIYLQFSVRLGRALNPGEYRIKLYLLRTGEIEVIDTKIYAN